MAKKKAGVPNQYSDIMADHPKLSEALEALGVAIRQEGPIDAKTAHLIQLSAAASIHSEGSVHSHVKRALEAGATPEEIRHALILLVSTIGFPSVAAALSWVDDVLKKKLH
jgi:4-carboxymuconolactone decarboxylase